MPATNCHERQGIWNSSLDDIHDFREVDHHILHEIDDCIVYKVDQECQKCQTTKHKVEVLGILPDSVDGLLRTIYQVYEYSYQESRIIGYMSLIALTEEIDYWEDPRIAPDLLLRANKLGLNDADDDRKKRPKDEVLRIVSEQR